jgi:hypothetical protein
MSRCILEDRKGKMVVLHLVLGSVLGISVAKPSPPENCTLRCAGAPLPLNRTVPNVLLVSDSIGASGSGYLDNVAQMLNGGASETTGGGAVGNAFVQHSGANWTGISGYCGTSIGVAACAAPWLRGVVGGAGGFDVIHFNWGLHDIAPSMYYPIEPSLYAANMEAIYQHLRKALAPNGTLVWTTTTPVPPSYKNRNNSDVLRINEQMRSLFGPGAAHPEVVVHDLYGEIVARCSRDGASAGFPQTSDCLVLQSDGVHMSAAGRQYTGIMVAASILPFL